MLSAMLENKSEGMRYEKILIKTFFETKQISKSFALLKKTKLFEFGE